MTAYYNEHDHKAALWLRELIKQGHIAHGVVDERSIEDVTPDDLRGFAQCHFFAGIGVWSYSLRLAGWPDTSPVWTGSCPCQPFSQAGKGNGFSDERHLWPAWHWLIQQCRPAVVFGEQVASKAAEPWIDLIQTDLEAMDYAFGCVPFAAAGVGAPHIRERAYWVADAEYSERRTVNIDREDGRDRQDSRRQETPGEPGTCGEILRLADSSGERLEGCDTGKVGGQRQAFKRGGGSFRLADADEHRCSQRWSSLAEAGNDGIIGNDSVCRVADSGYKMPPRGECGVINSQSRERKTAGNNPYSQDVTGPSATGPTNGHWRDADWLFCRDGKWRPIEPGTSPLAHGASARVGRLRGYGNAINAEAAKVFIESYLDK